HARCLVVEVSAAEGDEGNGEVSNLTLGRPPRRHRPCAGAPVDEEPAGAVDEDVGDGLIRYEGRPRAESRRHLWRHRTATGGLRTAWHGDERLRHGVSVSAERGPPRGGASDFAPSVEKSYLPPAGDEKLKRAAREE